MFLSSTGVQEFDGDSGDSCYSTTLLRVIELKSVVYLSPSPDFCSALVVHLWLHLSLNTFTSDILNAAISGLRPDVNDTEG